ncbi:MAG: PAS domain-containing protein [Lachnospiraceae bacterium]
MLEQMMKSVLEQDRAAVVICDCNHIIVYMNPAAIRRYAKRGGADLIGINLLNCHNSESGEMIRKVLDWFRQSTENNMIYTYHNAKENKDVYMVALRNDKKEVIGYYEKHEYRDKEKANLYDFSNSLI